MTKNKIALSDNQDNYLDTFESRGDLYNAASGISETARNVERDLLINLMQVGRDHVVCDAPAGGGYLADGLRDYVAQVDHLVCVEPSKTFARPLSPDYTVYNTSICDIPVENESFDRIGSLAGLHHVADKFRFVREAARVLKPGGLLAIGDVQLNSAVARFLNGPVDRLTTAGHQGMFIRTDEYSRCFEQAGLESAYEQLHEFHWIFDSVEQMVDYCKNLFGMVKAGRNEVQRELYRHFEIEKDGTRVMMPWSLSYGVGIKKSSAA